MANRPRPIILHLEATESKKSLIEHKMKKLGTKNFGAYARKILFDGYIIKVDYTEQKKLAAARTLFPLKNHRNNPHRRTRIQGRNPRKMQRQDDRSTVSLISQIQERITEVGSKGHEYKAKITLLKEAARTLNYLAEDNLLQHADLEKKADDICSSYDRIGKELKNVEARRREVQPLIKNISSYQRLNPVYEAFQKAKDQTSFKAKHEAELVIFEAVRSTLLAMQGDEKLPSLKALQVERQRLLDEQQRLYDEYTRLKKGQG